MCVPQGSLLPAADPGLSDGGGHTGLEDPAPQRRGEGSRLLRALPQLPAGEAAGAPLHTHLHTHSGQVLSGTPENLGKH